MRLLLPFLFLMLLFSCSEDGTKKELTGPHAEVQLIYLEEGERGVGELKEIPFEIKKEIYTDSVLLKTLYKLKEKPSSKELEELKNRIKVKEREGTDILEIKLYGKEQDFSLYFLEKLVETLNEEENSYNQQKAKKIIVKCEKELDSLTLLLKRSYEARKMSPEELVGLIEKYANNKNAWSDEEKKSMLKIIEDNKNIDEFEEQKIRIEELEKMYSRLLEERSELQIQLAGYIPRIKMIDHPRWVEK